MFEAQKWIGRNRRPRVQITYDVEIGNAIEMKELPCVVGVISDLSGDRDPDNPLPNIRDRKFKEIDRDNFSEIMNGSNVRLALQVNNTLAQNAMGTANTMLNVLLNFRTMDDFSPVSVLNQVPELNQLYQIRSKLRDLLIKLDGNDQLDDLLTDLLTNQDQQKQLSTELQKINGQTSAPKATTKSTTTGKTKAATKTKAKVASKPKTGKKPTKKGPSKK